MMLSIKKIYIVYLINFFMMVCITIALLISLYYATPDNYKIIPNKKIKKRKAKNIIVSKNSMYMINKDEIKNNYFSFDKNLELIVGNVLKTQNTSYKKNTTMVLNLSSNITIVNNSNEDIEIKFYQSDVLID